MYSKGHKLEGVSLNSLVDAWWHRSITDYTRLTYYMTLTFPHWPESWLLPQAKDFATKLSCVPILNAWLADWIKFDFWSKPCDLQFFVQKFKDIALIGKSAKRDIGMILGTTQ